ncbi:von Willebrand factor type A [Cylindrospermum sp. NIES-4074]|nr:von Willebrand factor type A [Cylindrospermum sp. NIES-4074]
MLLIHIEQDEIGIVYKKIGRPLPAGCRISLNGEVGWQAEILRPGWHTYLPNVEIRKDKAIYIASHEIGLVEAKDGASLLSGENFGKVVECNNFQDARAFIQNGGQRGKQRAILRTGTYWINTELFSVEKREATRIAKDKVGIVEARDGKPLPPGRTFGKVVECNSFQDPKNFINNGGESGKQLAILTAATYYINTDMFKVERFPCVRIQAGQIGLVRARDGKPLSLGRTFGKVVECNSFQDAQAFLNNGGQSGKQLAILTAGDYQINTELFEISIVSVTHIPPGEIGLVVANDGASRPEERILGKVVECSNFEDAQAFINNGGQKGKQLPILTAGDYQINTDLFIVITTANAAQYNIKPDQLKVYTVDRDKIGIITTLDGKTLPEGEIAGSIITEHNHFQEAQKFIELGGYKGLQQEFLSEGSWNLNPWFVQVEQVPLIEILAEKVGVVISYIGKVADSDIKNSSRLVDEGFKGVQKKPLRPGKYAINTRIKSIQIVPTNEIILNWSKSEGKPTENYDKTLEPLKLRSKDGFTFNMQVTQIISIAEEDAPVMILKVGAQSIDPLKLELSNSLQIEKAPAIKNLVTKVLSPMIDSYFRISAQDNEALDFLEKRFEIQQGAAEYIREALNDYGVQSVKTVITEIDLPDELEKLLKARKILEEQAKNYEREELTERQRQNLINQQEINKAQANLVKAQQNQEITNLNTQTDLIKAQSDAQVQQIKDNLELNRKERELGIDSTYKKQIKDIDINEFRERVKILTPEVYAQIELEGRWAEAHANAQIKLPEVFIGGSGNNSNGGDIVQASAMQMAFLEVLRDSLKSTRQINQINIPQQRENLPPAADD